MSRLLTENEWIGKLLESPVSYALQLLKDKGAIKNVWSNVPLKHGGDLDHIVQLNDGSFLHLEDMNFNTKYSYDERMSRIKELPERLRKAKELFGKVHETMLIITDCLTASREWLNENHILPIIIGEQIREPLGEKALVNLCEYLATRIQAIIEKITSKSRMLFSLSNLIGFVKSCFLRFIGFFQTILKSDDIKWNHISRIL